MAANGLGCTYAPTEAGAVTLATTIGAAHAEKYPSRPVRMIVGLPPGNSPDIVARIVCQYLSHTLGQPFIVDNRPGAGTSIATGMVVHATPDGDTLLLALAGDTVIGWLYKLDFDFIRDTVPIASIGGIPLAMVVTPSLPVKTIPEFITYAKAHPDKILMGSSGIGSLPHVLGEMFAMMAGINLVHVPYRESVFPDLLSGRVQIVVEPVPAVLGYIKAGKLRPLGVSSKQRITVLPDVPTIAEFLPGYEGSGWIGVGAPAHTPTDIVETLNHAVTAGLSDPKVKMQLIALGVIPDPMTPQKFKEFIAAESYKWGKVVEFAHITMQ